MDQMVIVLGDQSPWCGGLLRYQVVREMYSEAEVLYFFHDTDAPWVQSGGCVTISRGNFAWPPYFSLAVRFPWSFAVPGIGQDAIAQSVLGTFKDRGGLWYLTGPATIKIIAGCNGEVVPWVRLMLQEEVAWAKFVAEVLGQEIVSEISITSDNDLVGLVSALNGGMIRKSTEVFSEQLLLTRALPASHYWLTDVNKGFRRKWTGEKLNKGEILVPGAEALVLEFAARGWLVGCTNLAYLQRVEQVRNRFTPGLKIKIAQVIFHWALEKDPVSVLMDYYRARKRRRNQTPAEVSEPVLENIRSYWRSRPTSISYHILGGNLNARVEFKEI
jgi:hypothetical protein